MSETENISKMAEIVSQEIFNFFKWGRVDLYNVNFECKKPTEHSSKDTYTHPVDVVYHYLDPYTGKRVILNTDLKSYAAGTITTNNVRNALKSLAKTIECAKLSTEWKERYAQFSEPLDIRALLFVYNHKGNFDKEFYSTFFHKKPDDKKQIIDPASIPLKKGHLLHIIEPLQISYLYTLINDLQSLISNRKFPHFDESKHWFYYPELYLHKTHFNKYERAASLEMICSDFIIVGHDSVANNLNQIVENAGYVVYYNGRGEKREEFIYLLDTLSRNQLLDSSASIKIRCTHHDKHPDITTSFKNAINDYSAAWGFDDYKRSRLSEILQNFHTISQIKTILSDVNVGWRVAE
ncbi:hypothetical protein [Rheinheimera sp.]|uniref:hypothetical protein n=1 Tax=Rheinheimera sp. TaxID=1869214 RepID=UPI003D2E10B5